MTLIGGGSGSSLIGFLFNVIAGIVNNIGAKFNGGIADQIIDFNTALRSLASRSGRPIASE